MESLNLNLNKSEVIENKEIVLKSYDKNDFLNCSVDFLDSFLSENNTVLQKKFFEVNNCKFLYINNNKEYSYNTDYILSMFRNVIYVQENDKYIMLNYTHNSVYFEYVLPILFFDVKNKTKIYESFDGTNIVVFFWKDKWYYSTSKNINMFESKFANNKTHGDMFMDALGCSLDEFEKHLNTNYNYNFIIVHHNNKYIVDYTNIFKDNKYSKLIFTDSKDKTNQMPVYDDKFDNYLIDKKNLLKPKQVKLSDINLSYLNTYVYKIYDGYLIKIHKLVTNMYMKMKELNGNYQTNLEVYIYNFQKNRIDEFVNAFNL